MGICDNGGMNESNANHTPSNPIIAALIYIDEAARTILNNAAQNEGWEAPPLTEVYEDFADAIEAASCGAPLELFPTLSPDDMTLLGGLIEARIQSLLISGPTW
jgi:hypothetical protein